MNKALSLKFVSKAFITTLVVFACLSGAANAATLLGEYSFENDRTTPAPTIYNDALDVYDATNSGTTLALGGGPGGANYRVFDGADYINQPNFLAGQASYSIALWFSSTQTAAGSLVGANSTYLISISDLTGNGTGKIGTGVGQIRFAQNTSGWDTAIWSNSNTLNTGAWNFVAVTYDGTTVRMYINGALQTATTAASGALSTGQDEVIGAYTAGGVAKFVGGLDDVSYYQGALTGAEVLSLYNAVPEPGTWACVVLGGAVVVAYRRRVALA